MTKVKVWAIVFCVVAGVLWMSSAVINSPLMDGYASPWYRILGNIGFAIAVVLAVIYALNAEEHKGKKGDWWVKLLILFPVYLIIEAIINIVYL